MVVGYLVHDEHSLRACARTCRSLRFAATQHLHETLRASIYPTCDKKRKWPKPLWRAYKLGYLPFLTRVVISGALEHVFFVHQFSWLDRRNFARLENVQVLSIDNLDLAGFIPKFKTYFGHFHSLRYLALTGARGSGDQLVFFIGSFPQLEDLTIYFCQGDP